MLAIPLSIAGGRQEPPLPESPCLGIRINQMRFVAANPAFQGRVVASGNVFGLDRTIPIENMPRS
jgi:hypothetical protein